jgi:hypothetical protein
MTVDDNHLIGSVLRAHNLESTEKSDGLADSIVIIGASCSASPDGMIAPGQGYLSSHVSGDLIKTGQRAQIRPVAIAQLAW